MAKRYKLNMADVDVDGDPHLGPDYGCYILNLPNGFRFDDDIVHVKGYDTLKELRADIKVSVIPCDCKSCFPTL